MVHQEDWDETQKVKDWPNHQLELSPGYFGFDDDVIVPLKEQETCTQDITDNQNAEKSVQRSHDNVRNIVTKSSPERTIEFYVRYNQGQR